MFAFPVLSLLLLRSTAFVYFNFTIYLGIVLESRELCREQFVDVFSGCPDSLAKGNEFCLLLPGSGSPLHFRCTSSSSSALNFFNLSVIIQDRNSKFYFRKVDLNFSPWMNFVLGDFSVGRTFPLNWTFPLVFHFILFFRLCLKSPFTSCCKACKNIRTTCIYASLLSVRTQSMLLSLVMNI